MSDLDRRRFMKLTGVGAAGAAMGTGAGAQSPSLSRPVPTQESTERFIALSETVRLAVNAADPDAPGIEITPAVSPDSIHLDATAENGTWSATQEQVTVPDLVNVLLDLVEDDDFDLVETLQALVTPEDLATIDAFIADTIRDLDLREILAAVDTEQLLSFLVAILEGLDLPGDDERGGDGAGRQILNELGYMLGLQYTFENPEEIEDEAEDMEFRPGGVVNLSGFLEEETVYLEGCVSIFCKDEEVPIANIDSADGLLADPSVDRFTELFEKLPESLAFQFNDLPVDDVIIVDPDDFDDLTQAEPRLDRIVDMVLTLLNSETFDDFLGDDNGDNGDDGPDISCTGEGPVVDDDEDDESLLAGLEDFLYDDLGVPETAVDVEAIESFLEDFFDEVGFDDLMEDLSDLEEDDSGHDSGYVGSLEEVVLDPIADAFDPDEGGGFFGEFLDVLDDALALDELDGSEAGDTLEELSLVLRREDDGLELTLDLTGLAGTYQPGEGLLTASVDDAELDLAAADDGPELAADVVNVLLDDADEISVQEGEEVLDVLARGLSEASEDIDIDPEDVEEELDLLLELLGSIGGGNGDDGDNDEANPISDLLDEVLDGLGEEFEATAFDDILEPFREDGEFELDLELDLTTATSGDLEGGFERDDIMGTATATTVDNEFSVGLETAIEMLTGDDPDTTGISDVDIVAELEGIELADVDLEDFVTNEVTDDDWDALRDQVDDLLSGFAGSGTGDENDPVCEYEWGDDDDGSNSAGNEWESSVNRLNDRNGAGNVQFIGEDFGGDMAAFLEHSLDNLATHVETEVGGAENLVAGEQYGLVNALDSVPPYAPGGVDSPLQIAVDILVGLLELVVDTGDGTGGVVRDYAGAHAVDLDFDLTYAPTEPIGGLESPPMDRDGDGRLEDIRGDGTTDIYDVQALFDNMEESVISDFPAAFNFSNASPDDEVMIFDVGSHWRQYVHDSD